MSMTTYVEGIIPADDKFKKMEAIWNACEAVGVPIPVDVIKFFDGRRPDTKGVRIALSGESDAVKRYNDENSEGYEVDLSLLAKDIKILRFINSW